MTQATMFARLIKVDEAKRQVTGVIASETPDRAKEIFDYDTSKPNFIDWSSTLAKATDGKSVGNLRAMHANVAAGRLVELNCDDMNKTITVVAEVVDDNEWEKVTKGVYTGFSIGGKYAKKWEDPVRKGYKRYTAIPSEVSLVDLACNPEATFVMVKADGMEEQVPFHHPDEAELLAKLSSAEATPEEKADAAQRLAKLYSPDPVNQEDEELEKGAWTIESLARAAEQAEHIALCYGVKIDGALRPFTDNVKKAAVMLYDALVQMVDEDVAAAKERLKGVKKAVEEDELQKQTEAEELRKQAEQSAIAEHEALSKVFGISAFGISNGAKLDDAVESISKFVSAHDELKKAHDALKAEIEDLKKRAEPAKGSVRSVPVSKAEDGKPATGDLTKAEGTSTEAPTDPLELVKMAHANPMRVGMGSLTKPA